MKATITTLGLTLYLFFCAIPAEGRVGFLGNCCGQAQGQRPACLQKCGNLEINARAIYWRSSTGGEAVASLQDQILQANDIALEDQLYALPNWEWGWGVGATYLFPCGCWHLAARYVYWKDHYSTHATAGTDELLFAPYFGGATFLSGNPSTVELPLASVDGAIRRRYQHLDGECGYALLCRPHHLLHIYGGVRYMRFTMKERYVGVVSDAQNEGVPPDPGSSLFPVQNSSTEGVGLRAGLAAAVDLCWGFSLSSHVGVDGLWAHCNHFLIARDINFLLAETSNEYVYPKFRRFITGLDGHLSLTYQKEFCGLSIIGEVGLEGHYYMDGMMRVLSSQTLYMPIPLVTGFGFGGPYLELSLAY